MDFDKVINNRKTIRKFDSYVPTVDEVKRIIDSARVAPCAMNVQNWKFIAVLNNDVKNEMAKGVIEAYDRILAGLNEDEKEKVERFKGHSTFFTHAPLVVVCVEKDAPAFMSEVLEKSGIPMEEIKLMRPDSYLLSMGGAIENMLLTAYDMGLGSCWMVAPVLGQKGIREVLKLKDDEKITSILAFGKPAADISDKRSPKKPLEEVMEIIL